MTESGYKKLALVATTITLTYMGLGALRVAGTPILGVMFCPGHEICRVYQDSPAEKAGIRLGDRILTVDGVPVRDAGPLGSGPSHAGDMRLYEIERAGEILEIQAELGRPHAGSIYLRLGPTIVGFFFVLIGFYVFYHKSSQLSGTFLLFCLAVGWMVASPTGRGESYGRFLAGTVEVAAWFACASLLVYLFCIFPRKKRLVRDHPGLVKLMFAVAGLAAGGLVLELAFTLLLGLNVPSKLLVFLNYVTGIVIIGYFLLAAGSFIHGYFTSPPGQPKQLMRLVLGGIILGILPVTVYSVLFAIDPQVELPLEGHVVLFAVLIPSSLGAAVLRLPSFETQDRAQ